MGLLDAAGNTTAAIGKGFAIGSAALVSLALFGAFTVRAKVTSVDILNPWVFTGLLFGAMMPYAFAAWTMKSVGKAANDMVKECLEQFPKIMGPERMTPDYEKCIRISTEARDPEPTCRWPRFWQKCVRWAFVRCSGVKRSEAHKNSVTGDTVGDPLKDTSGPALNIVMKLTAIISLVFGSAIADFSNAEGGPFWLH